MKICWAFKMKAGNATCTCVHRPGRVRLPVHGVWGIFVSLAFVFACSGAVAPGGVLPRSSVTRRQPLLPQAPCRRLEKGQRRNLPCSSFSSS